MKRSGYPFFYAIFSRPSFLILSSEIGLIQTHIRMGTEACKILKHQTEEFHRAMKQLVLVEGSEQVGYNGVPVGGPERGGQLGAGTEKELLVIIDSPACATVEVDRGVKCNRIYTKAFDGLARRISIFLSEVPLVNDFSGLIISPSRIKD